MSAADSAAEATAAAAPAAPPPAGHTGQWTVLRSVVTPEVIVEQSRALLAASARLPPEELEHAGMEWKASRNYLQRHDQELFRELREEELEEWEAEELLQADAFNPLVDAVITAAQHHCGCRHGQLKLDGAFSTLYRGEVKGMADHIDYGSKNHVVPVSAILQCHTDAGFQGGGLWMRPAEKSSASDGTADSDEADGDEPPALRHADGRVLVELAPGDMLLLEGAWHQPREITGSTSERLVLVSFFKVVKPKPSGGLVQGEPEPQAESSGCFSAESPSHE